MIRLYPYFSTHISFARVSHSTLLLIWVLALLLPMNSLAQTGDDEVINIQTSLVQLNVGVSDRKGQAVTNLTASDFVVYEDDIKQPLTSFAPSSTPSSLVLMLDTSGSTLAFRQTLKQAAIRFLDALAVDDRVCIVAFNDRTRILARFTTDRRKLAYAIDQAGGRGGTELFDALTFSLKQLAGEGKRRKAIVVLTDGVDSKMSRLDRLAAASASTDEEAVNSIKPEASQPLNSVLDAADRQGVTIYTLALPDGRGKRQSTPTPMQMAVYTSARARLETIARRTGGRIHDMRRLEDMGRLYAEIAADMRSLYSIAYQPSGGRERDGSWRTIRIEVARPELIARTRPGYYAR